MDRVRASLVLVLLSLALLACGGGKGASDTAPGADADAAAPTDVTFVDSHRADAADTVPPTPDSAEPGADADTPDADVASPDAPPDAVPDARPDAPPPDAPDPDAAPDAAPDVPADALPDSTDDADLPAPPDGSDDDLPGDTPDASDTAQEASEPPVEVVTDVPPDPSDVAGADPGGPDLPPLPLVAVNEVVAKAVGAGPDWIELFNPGDVAVDLGGWTLKDDDDAHLCPLPAETLLEPGAFLLVEAAGGASATVLPFGLGKADALRLYDADGVLVDDTAWIDGAAPEGASWGRHPDGTGDFATLPTPTPGAPNVAPGPIQPPVDPAAPVFDPQAVLQVALTLPQASIEQLFADPRTYVPATITLTVEGQAPDTLEVGVRIKGKWGSFRDLNGKAAFKVKLDYSVVDQRWRDLENLSLNNMVQDASMGHEALAYRVFRAFDVPAPRTGYAWVRVNGQDYGFYSVVETYDRNLLDRWYASTQHLYEGEYGTDLTPGATAVFDIDQGTGSDLSDLQGLITAANAPDEPTWPDTIGALTDFDEMLRMWAVEQYIGHWDGYSTVVVNNYFLHSDDDGRFSMMPWGTDQTFADTRDVHAGNGLLFRRCLALPACRLRFDQKLFDLLAVVDTLDLDAFAAQLASHVEPWAEIDPRKETSLDDLHATVQSTRDFLATRRVAVGDLVTCLLDPAADVDGDGYICDADCAEGDPATNPGAHDDCGDGLDQDCTGRADDALECPDCVERQVGPHRYLLCPNPRTFDEARTHCHDYGAELVMLEDELESARLYALLQSYGGIDRAWLGLTDGAEEGHFVWLDGSDPVVAGWGWGEPNDAGGEDCAEIYTWGAWNDLSCDARLSVVCEDLCAPGQDDDDDGFLRCGADCDDSQPAVHPGAVDTCNDGLDNDCDGYVDNGPLCLPMTTLTMQPPVPGARFTLLSDALDREEARAVCVAAGVGGDLAWLAAPIEAVALHNALAAVAPGADAWIGLSDQLHEDLYLWPDGAVPLFSDWAPTEPNNGSGTGEQDCVALLTTGDWADLDCALPLRAVCRLPTP